MYDETGPSATRRPLIGWAAVGVLAVVLMLVPGSAGADTTKPQLSIAVDNGQQSAVKGDELAYTITVANLGGAKVRDLVVTQSVPVDARFLSADVGGVHRAGKVTWKLDLKRTKKVILHASMTVATTPDGLLRLATVACAQLSTSGPPLVCAADSDQLPAGAMAQSAQEAAEESSSRSGQQIWWYSGAALALAGIVGSALLIVRTRRAARRQGRPLPPG